jgi:serine protease inhibitor
VLAHASIAFVMHAAILKVAGRGTVAAAAAAASFLPTRRGPFVS